MNDITKAELFGHVLERLSQDRYEVSPDEYGETVNVKMYGPTLEEMEDFLREPLNSLEDLQETIQETDPENPLARAPLAEHWDDWWTERLHQEVFGLEEGKKLAGLLKGLQYGQVITILYGLLTEGFRSVAHPIVFYREQLDTIDMAQLESRLLQRSPESVDEVVASEYARRIGNSFPKMMRRASTLRMLPAELKAPPEVQKYLTEATKCFIYGQFIACLLLCRSAIEFAIRDRLIKEGYREDLEQLPDDSLAYVIKLAQKKLPWAYKATLDQADIVRDVARKAVHREPPETNRCQEMFCATRSILERLYSTPKTDL